MLHIYINRLATGMGGLLLILTVLFAWWRVI